MSVQTDTGPFTIIPGWVLNAPISSNAVRLYGVLGLHADANGQCFPSRKALAERVGVSVRSVIRAKNELIEIGALKCVNRARSNGSQTSNGYLLVRADPSPPRDTAVTPPVTRLSPPELEPVELEEEAKASSGKGASKSRPRDPIWDAFADFFGAAPNGKLSRGPWNAAIKSMRDEGCDGSDVADVIAEYQRAYPDAPVTTTAIAKHYPVLRAQRSKRQRKAISCAVCGVGAGLHTADCPNATVHTQEAL